MLADGLERRVVCSSICTIFLVGRTAAEPSDGLTRRRVGNYPRSFSSVLPLGCRDVGFQALACHECRAGGQLLMLRVGWALQLVTGPSADSAHDALLGTLGAAGRKSREYWLLVETCGAGTAVGLTMLYM